ncbi:cytidine deaminase [Clostridium manihotivorum]|uniref:Cytidine deaminase n=1 Tax=Clostridium manihotivorum TaxID=2320868 RepID=A0A3R5UES3_9CLOT|nr:cytidine deaminase [Clostridium manihotivorum]QAA31733.1 cytidine deaminase [Clostridium manihotivorum]
MYEQLIKAAINARDKAYAPYSNFPVGAAIISDGKIFEGCNIENASFGATNCAERTAIFKAVSEGHKSIEAVAVIGDVNAYTYPCGICRQVIAEFAKDTKIPIIIIKNEKEYIVKTLEDILPGIFSKEDLNK